MCGGGGSFVFVCWDVCVWGWGGGGGSFVFVCWGVGVGGGGGSFVLLCWMCVCVSLALDPWVANSTHTTH